MTAGQDIDQPVRTERAERKRREQRDVICGERAEPHPLQRGGQETDAEPVIGERQRSGRRPEE